MYYNKNEALQSMCIIGLQFDYKVSRSQFGEDPENNLTVRRAVTTQYHRPRKNLTSSVKRNNVTDATLDVLFSAVHIEIAANSEKNYVGRAGQHGKGTQLLENPVRFG